MCTPHSSGYFEHDDGFGDGDGDGGDDAASAAAAPATQAAAGPAAFVPDAAAADDSPAPLASAPADATRPIAADALRPEGSATASTPRTEYSLRPPLEPVNLAASGDELRRQAAALLCGGDESRRRAIVFAREVMALAPSEFAQVAASSSSAHVDDSTQATHKRKVPHL